MGNPDVIKRDAETAFEEYREDLHAEIVRLALYVGAYRRLEKRKQDRLDEMNCAPEFFQAVLSALFTAIVVWIHNLYDKKSERGLHDFLSFVQDNPDLFSISELQRRRNYPDGHWMLEREPITRDTIAADKEKIPNLACLPSIKLRRDKFHAHFDKEYFHERKKLAKDAPLKWEDLTQVLKVAEDILNKYSSEYDGVVYASESHNASDVDYLLDMLHRLREYDKEQ